MGMKQRLNKFWSNFKKIFTHNRCDSCGFTKEEVYLTELYLEGGYRQCTSCIKKEKSKENN